MIASVMMYKRGDGECASCKQDPLVFIKDLHTFGMYREDSGAANELLSAEGGMDVFIKNK